MENTPETTAVDGGLPRRTVLAGAAWTIPVIAAATITPTASASGTLQLAFDKTTYNGTACSTITGAYVTATTNGVATTGASITVSLSNGYTFSGGATSATGLSGTDGRYVVPDINVPVAGGTSTVTAGSGSQTASSSIKGAPAATAVFTHWSPDTGQSGYINMTTNGVPANATPVGFDTWLTPGGDLYRSATKIATNVTAAVAQFVNNGSGAVGVKTSYQTSTAVFTHWSPDTGQSGYINMTTNGVPANATPVGFDTWLTPDRDLQ
ncbi:hypothetical protein NS206_17895 [Microbacterium testaceum]|uniref:hypothetical protein n=1 Tax=Microbacterium testaceum TaxID=2033 RepID=UPI000734DD13|nr:hypothetical protein [Microbacterium testaceum]KTS55212.1 hypothetical protein NS206_17895 [Microbacterium testaceum]